MSFSEEHADRQNVIDKIHFQDGNKRLVNEAWHAIRTLDLRNQAHLCQLGAKASSTGGFILDLETLGLFVLTRMVIFALFSNIFAIFVIGVQNTFYVLLLREGWVV